MGVAVYALSGLARDRIAADSAADTRVAGSAVGMPVNARSTVVGNRIPADRGTDRRAAAVGMDVYSAAAVRGYAIVNDRRRYAGIVFGIYLNAVAGVIADGAFCDQNTIGIITG